MNVADCGHHDPNPYRDCPWTGRLRLVSLCRACHEDACRRYLREWLGIGHSAGLLSDRRQARRHVSEAA